MRCVNCGNEMKASAKFCTQCGSFVDAETLASEQSPGKASPTNIAAPAPIPAPHVSYTGDNRGSVPENAVNAPIVKNRNNALMVLMLVGFLAISGSVGILLKNTFFSKSQEPSTPIVNNNVTNPTASQPNESVDPTEAVDNEPDPSTGEGTSTEEPDGYGVEPWEIGYIIDGSDSRYLTKLELEGMNAETLRIARNEIYARHGRMFKDLAMQEYFDFCTWYTPSIAPDDFQQALLNAYELENIKLIISYEEEKGYR